jgi:multidrug resistance efflux pump
MPRPEEIPIAEAKVREMRTLVADAREQYARAERGSRTGAVTEDETARRKNAVSTAEAQLARSEAELALLKEGAWKPDLAVAQAQIELADAQLKQTITELERLTVRASVTGKILQKNLRPGEYVGVPPNQALLVIGDVSTLHVRMDVDENDIGRFQSELRGKAFTRGANKRHFDLVFVRVEPSVVPKKSLTGMGTERVDTRVLQVIYALQNPDDKLFVGQQMDVYLETK